MSLTEKLIHYKHKVAGKYIPVRSDQIAKEFLKWKNISFQLKLMEIYASFIKKMTKLLLPVAIIIVLIA